MDSQLMNDRSRGPDFLIAGMQKSGTTALWHQLGQHRQIFFPDRKELHFFDRERIDWKNPDYSLYENFFSRCPPDCVAGEATPIYTYWPRALDRIGNYKPSMKLIILLRNPVARAFSQWSMEFGWGRETRGFEEAIKLRLNRPEAIQGLHTGAHRIFSYVERSLYEPQMSTVYKHFPRDQVFCSTYEKLSLTNRELLKNICTFLQIESYKKYPKNKTVLPNKQHIKTGPVPEAIFRNTIEIFRDDILKTQQLTGLDLTSWLRSPEPI